MATEVRMTAEVVDGSQFETVRYPADEILLRVTQGGNVQVVEYESTDRDGPPAHYHPWDEIEYVIEGTVEFYVDGKVTVGGPGTVQLLPAGSAHSVRIPSGTARILMITIGPPYDGFARDVAAFLASENPDMANLAPIAGRHGVGLEGH